MPKGDIRLAPIRRQVDIRRPEAIRNPVTRPARTLDIRLGRILRVLIRLAPIPKGGIRLAPIPRRVPTVIPPDTDTPLRTARRPVLRS